MIALAESRPTTRRRISRETPLHEQSLPRNAEEARRFFDPAPRAIERAADHRLFEHFDGGGQRLIQPDPNLGLVGGHRDGRPRGENIRREARRRKRRIGIGERNQGARANKELTLQHLKVLAARGLVDSAEEGTRGKFRV
jgi:hypothetical protein